MRLQRHIREASGDTSLHDIVKVLYKKSKDFMLYMKKNKVDDFMYSGRDNSKDIFIKAVREHRGSKDTPQEISDEFDARFYKKFKWYPRSEAIFVTGDSNIADGYGDNAYMIFPVGKFKFLWNPQVTDLWSNVIEDSVIQSQYDNGDEPLIDEYEADDKRDEFASEIESEWEYNNHEPVKEDFMMGGIDDEEEEIVDMAAFNQAQDDWETEKYDFIDNEVAQLMNDWMEDKNQDFQNDIDELYDDTVDGYTDKKLNHAIDSGREIMLNCKEYVAVIEQYYSLSLLAFIGWYHWRSEPTIKDMDEFIKKYNFANKKGGIYYKEKPYINKDIMRILK